MPSCLGICDREVSRTRIAAAASGFIVPSCIVCGTFTVAVYTHVICMTKITKIGGLNQHHFSRFARRTRKDGAEEIKP